MAKGKKESAIEVDEDVPVIVFDASSYGIKKRDPSTSVTKTKSKSKAATKTGEADESIMLSGTKKQLTEKEEE